MFYIVKNTIKNGEIRYGLFKDAQIIRTSKNIDVLFDIVKDKLNERGTDLKIINYVD